MSPKQLPFITAARGTGGILKRFDEDFFVEEVPRYAAIGEGTHVYFKLEKRGLTTLAAVSEVAQALGKNRRDIGYAGLKDAHGVTRQWFSAEHVDPARVRTLGSARMSVLEVTRHTNKIKLGHLAGNRFDVRIRDVTGDAPERATAIVDVLVRRGVPNYFGPQRFGVRGDNAAIGYAILHGDYDEAIARLLGRPNARDDAKVARARRMFDAGDYQAAARAWPGPRFTEQAKVARAFARSGGDARKAWRAVNHTLRRLYLSAFQSELFNRVLAERILELDRLQTGDLAWKHANGACFVVEDAPTEQARCNTFEISPTGPIFGRRMKRPKGAPAEMERRVLAQAGIKVEAMDGRGSGRLDGARRPLRVPLADAAVSAGHDERGDYLRLSFFLPPGSYATSVLREVTKA